MCIELLDLYSPFIRHAVFTLDPDANLPRLNKNMVYLGACIIAGMRLTREKTGERACHSNHQCNRGLR
jgi:hypothetical protein